MNKNHDDMETREYFHFNCTKDIMQVHEIYLPKNHSPSNWWPEVNMRDSVAFCVE